MEISNSSIRNGLIQQAGLIGHSWTQHYQSIRHNWYQLISSSNNRRIHVFLKLTWNIHILSHKIHLNKFKIMKIVWCQLSDLYGITLEINFQIKSTWKSPNAWRFNKTLLNNARLNKKPQKKGGTNWESSIETWTLLYVKQIASGNLLCDVGTIWMVSTPYYYLRLY